VTATVKTALLQEKKNEWVVGWMVSGPKLAHIEPCSATSTKYSTRNAAVRTALLGIKQLLAEQAPTKGNFDAEIARLEAWLKKIGTPPAEKKMPAKKPAPKGAK
jgi:hypothetical protein